MQIWTATKYKTDFSDAVKNYLQLTVKVTLIGDVKQFHKWKCQMQ